MKTENWTAINISDLSGKVAIVTGGSSGLGYETVKMLAAKGAEVTIASRTLANSENARNQILEQIPKAKLKVMHLDLGDLDSVRVFADQFSKSNKRLDILMNNAGVMTVPYEDIKSGKTGQMQTNHLGHFALTALLLDLIIKTPDSRVVTTSSLAYKQGVIDFDNLLFESKKGYSPTKAYGRSKLANLLFTFELQRLFEINNINSKALAAHPGLSLTNLGRHVEQKVYFKLFGPLLKLIVQSAEMGALPQLRAAVDRDVKGGEYFGPKGFGEITGFPVMVKTNKASRNTADANKLWEVSEKLTGVNFDFT